VRQVIRRRAQGKINFPLIQKENYKFAVGYQPTPEQATQARHEE